MIELIPYVCLFITISPFILFLEIGAFIEKRLTNGKNEKT